MERNKKKVFENQVTSFAKVVDVLLKNPKANREFRNDPIRTLESYGINCVNKEIKKRLETELLKVANDIQPGQEVMVAVPFVAAAILVEVAVTIGPEMEEDLSDGIFDIDQERVDAFVDPIVMQEKIKDLESEVELLRSKLGR